MTAQNTCHHLLPVLADCYVTILVSNTIFCSILYYVVLEDNNLIPNMIH